MQAEVPLKNHVTDGNYWKIPQLIERTMHHVKLHFITESWFKLLETILILTDCVKSRMQTDLRKCYPQEEELLKLFLQTLSCSQREYITVIMLK